VRVEQPFAWLRPSDIKTAPSSPHGMYRQIDSGDRARWWWVAQPVDNGDLRFRALVQHATDMIVVIDSEGLISYESPAVERILGWKPDQRLGTPALDTVHPAFLSRAQAALKEVLEHPATSRTVELQKQDTSGHWHWVESTFTNLLDEPPSTASSSTTGSSTSARHSRPSSRTGRCTTP
jgi:PAS domain S-box-containing protein